MSSWLSRSNNDPTLAANKWYEAMKSELTNPFQTMGQLEILKQRHDQIENRLTHDPDYKTPSTQAEHDFFAEAIGLIIALKESQEKQAAVLPAADQAAKAAQAWSISLFDNMGINTEGRSFEQLSADKSLLLPTGVLSSWESQMDTARIELEAATNRLARDPTAKWAIDYWKSYEAEIRKVKPYLLEVTAARNAAKEAGSYVPPPVSPSQYRENAEAQARFDEQYKKAKEDELKPSGSSGLSAPNYLWWGVGISLALVLVFAVVA